MLICIIGKPVRVASSGFVSTPGRPTAATQGLAKTMMPVPEGHPDVFDVEWPLRVADVDREGRLKFDAATRHIQDVGTDQLREMGFEETHPLWIVRRTMIDMIEPIVFKDMLRLRRWCSGTSNRWCEMRVRIDGRKGGVVESEAFWININRETQGPARIADDSSRACGARPARAGCAGRPI